MSAVRLPGQILDTRPHPVAGDCCQAGRLRDMLLTVQATAAGRRIAKLLLRLLTLQLQCLLTEWFAMQGL